MKEISCPHCGQSHPAGVRFCPKTGQEIPVTPTCPYCGAAIEAGWLACANCGKRLSAGTAWTGCAREKESPPVGRWASIDRCAGCRHLAA
jgi:predicted nucleic acid-binding Zn ribbon protein